MKCCVVQQTNHFNSSSLTRVISISKNNLVAKLYLLALVVV